MIHWPSRVRRERPARIATCRLLPALVLLPGCVADPEQELCPVAGRLLVDDSPAAGGSVSLRSHNPKLGHQPTGSVSADGAYTLYTAGRPGAPAGEYRVLVFIHATGDNTAAGAHPPLPQSLIDPVYQDPARSPLSLSVMPSAAPGAYDLEVHRAYRP